MQVAILGRQPSISLAELECLYGAENITPISSYAALIKTDTTLRQDRLGGTVKSGTVIAELKANDANQAFSYIQEVIVDYANEHIFEGKIQLGFSLYGFKAQKNWLLKKSLEVKKILKKSGRSVRIIENKSETLEAAQVLYNKLTGSQGIEFLIIKNGPDVIIAQTTAVQNIDDYAARDFERPMRDAYVGMLPPKLAQIMINLAASEKSLDEASSQIQDLRSKICILDPFCGTGVVLQEALLMGHHAYGSDISEKMVDYSEKNLQWLTAHFPVPDPRFQVEVGDATSHNWNFSGSKYSTSSIAIATETYLGKPLTQLPDSSELTKIIAEAEDIAHKFLKNISNQIKKGTRLTVALPAWHVKDGQFKHLKVLDHLTDLGYNRLDLVHATKRDLIYHRENQVVARELTILEKI